MGDGDMGTGEMGDLIGASERGDFSERFGLFVAAEMLKDNLGFATREASILTVDVSVL
jgi:hypothetical protein